MTLYARTVGDLQALVSIGRRIERATETLPQTGDTSLFTITGGRILLFLIVGEVTVVIETQTNNAKLKLNPTAAGADQDLCAVLDITAKAVGELFTIDGIVANALRADLLIGQAGLIANPMILSEGIIELDCSASNTGSVKWSAFWVPLDEGADLASS